MLEQPLVSILILTYNHELYIRQALDSVLMQYTPFAYEIIINDDCSTDKTTDILMEYQSQHPNVIQLILQTKNVGATRGLYHLLGKARGQYIAALEGDDFWLDSQKLVKQLAVLQSNREYVGCASYSNVVDETGEPMGRLKQSWIRYRREFTLKDYQGVVLPGQFSSFFFRNVWLDNYVEPELYQIHSMIGDRTLVLLLLAHGKFHTIKYPLSAYRMIRHKNATNATSVFYIKQKYDILMQDITINAQLEALASKILDKPVFFQLRQRSLFAEAFLNYLRHPNDELKNTLKIAYKNCKNKLGALLFIPIAIAKKIWHLLSVK